MQLTELVTVYDQIKAEMINNILKDRGITCLLQSRASHNVHPFTVDGLAEIKILVESDKLEHANEIIKNFGFEK